MPARQASLARSLDARAATDLGKSPRWIDFVDAGIVALLLLPFFLA